MFRAVPHQVMALSAWHTAWHCLWYRELVCWMKEKIPITHRTGDRTHLSKWTAEIQPAPEIQHTQKSQYKFYWNKMLHSPTMRFEDYRSVLDRGIWVSNCLVLWLYGLLQYPYSLSFSLFERKTTYFFTTNEIMERNFQYVKMTFQFIHILLTFFVASKWTKHGC